MNKKIIIIGLLFGMFSCDEYLDIVPVQTQQIDLLFERREVAYTALATCYAYLPQNDGVYTSFMMMSDEVTYWETWDKHMFWSKIVTSEHIIICNYDISQIKNKNKNYNDKRYYLNRKKKEMQGYNGLYKCCSIVVDLNTRNPCYDN